MHYSVKYVLFFFNLTYIYTYIKVSYLDLLVKQQDFSLMTYTGLHQSFSLIKLRPFLIINCKLTFRSAFIQSTTNRKKSLIYVTCNVYNKYERKDLFHFIATIGLNVLRASKPKSQIVHLRLLLNNKKQKNKFSFFYCINYL